MILLAGPGVLRAQLPKSDPIADRVADAEMRRKLEPLIPSIRAALQGDNIDAQRAALAVTADFPPALAAEANLSAGLAAFLSKDHKDPEVIALGLRSFGKSDPDPSDIARIVGRYVKSPHTIVRRAVAESLTTAVQNSVPAGPSVANATKFIDVAKQAVPLLREGVSDSDEGVQRGALEGIRAVAGQPQGGAAGLTGLYTYDTGPLADEPKPKEKEKERDRFAPLEPIIKELAGVVPKMAVPLAGKEPATRITAARAAESLALLRRAIIAVRGPGTDPFAEGWLTLREVATARLKDESPAVRLAVTEALESLGDALEAREYLRQATTDQNVYVRWAAARALGRTAPARPDLKAVEADVAALARVAADRDSDVRTAGINALARFGPAAKAAVPVLLAAATHGDIEPRVAAIKALSAVESPSDTTVPLLTAALAEPDLRLRRAAATALVRFGPDARPALAELRKAINDADQDLRLAAAEAILAIERKPRLKDL
jgi:HEAT repeat protein